MSSEFNELIFKVPFISKNVNNESLFQTSRTHKCPNRNYILSNATLKTDSLIYNLYSGFDAIIDISKPNLTKCWSSHESEFPVSWNQAQRICSSQGQNLASVSSSDKLQQLYRFFHLTRFLPARVPVGLKLSVGSYVTIKQVQ